ADKNRIGSAGVVGDVTNGQSKSAGHILDVSRMLYRRRKAMADCNEPDPLLGEGFAECLCVLAIPRPQATPVHPKEDWEIFSAFWQKEIEFVSFKVGPFSDVIGNVFEDDDRRRILRFFHLFSHFYPVSEG